METNGFSGLNPDTVATQHPDFIASQKARNTWNDVMLGTLRLRDRHETYLPKFPAEMAASYKLRVNQSTFFNMTEKTRNVMTGLVFQAPIELQEDVPIAIKTDVWENFDNQGNHGDVFWRMAFEASFAGYAGVLIDAPTARANSLDEQRRLGLRPYGLLYHANNIINWRHRVNPISKAKELEMIVLQEITHEPDGVYRSRSVTRYRVFRLEDNAVTWELWEEESDKTAAQTTYRLEDRGVLDRPSIPFAVIGDLGAAPPLIDLALVNIKLFQKESDKDSLEHKTCAAMPIAKGLQKPSDGTQIVVSPDKLTEVSENGDFYWAEVSGSSLGQVSQSLLDLREQIALMGLSLLADKTAKVDITATEALLNNIGETAELRVMARQCQDAIEASFGFIAGFTGDASGGSVEMGTAWNVAEKQKQIEAEREEARFKLETRQPAAAEGGMVN